MGIDIAEHTETRHVPFGSPNSEGTPEAVYNGMHEIPVSDSETRQEEIRDAMYTRF